MRRFISYGPALVVLMTVMVVLLAGPAAVRRVGSAHTSARIILAQRSLDDDDILERLNKAVRNVAESVRPSVVHLEVIPSGQRRFMGMSTGTGWVYDTSGHIITNLHVVRGASAIRVQFSDGRMVETENIHGDEFVGDAYTDIAVIKVPESDGVFAAAHATGLQPQQGDRIFVFGSPFGFKFSMSEGIVSGLGRDPSAASEFNGYTNYIQTDAAVNPGNSGGPLVDIKGRVIGMNVAIATARASDGTTSDEGQSAGISFAIPLGTIESVASQLITRGQVKRGFLGIQWPPFEPTAYVPSAKSTAVRVDLVSKDGPADRAGIERGDLILSIADQATPSLQVLRSVITTLGPGQTVPIKVVREGEAKEFSVTLGEFSAETLAQTDAQAALVALSHYGLEFQERRDRRRIERLLRQDAQIVAVNPQSPAGVAGFETGQTVLQVGDTHVSNIGEMCEAAVQQGLLLGKRIPLLIAENNGTTSPAPKAIDVQVLR